MVDLNPAGPNQALEIVGIERERLLVGLQRLLRIAETGDRAEVSIGDRSVFAVLFRLRGRLLGLRRLVLGERPQQRGGVGDLVRFEEVESVLQARVAFRGPLRDRPDRFADPLLRAGPRRRIPLDQQFGQSGDLRVFRA